MTEVIAIMIVVLVFLISISCNGCLTYLFEEYIYEKYYLKEKEDEEYESKN